VPCFGHCTLGKDPVPIVQEVGWTSGLVWTAWKISPSLASNPWTVRPIAYHCTTDYTILASALNHNTNDYFLHFENINFHILLICLLFLQVWMSKGSGCDVPIHVIMLALYIELQLGVYSFTTVSY